MTSFYVNLLRKKGDYIWFDRIKEKKMNKCTKGHFFCVGCIHDQGSCVACPKDVKSCDNENIDNKKTCVDSCQKAKPKTKPTKKKLKPSTVPTLPKEKFSTFTGFFPNPSRPIYRSAIYAGEVNKYEPPSRSSNGHHPVNPWLIVSSVLCGALFALAIVSLVFVCRRIRRKKSRRSRVGTEGRRLEEDIPLNEIPPNVRVDENLRGDANNVEANVQIEEESNEEEPYPANVIEKNQLDYPAQETQPSVGTFDDGNQQSEEDARSSRLMLKETHS